MCACHSRRRNSTSRSEKELSGRVAVRTTSSRSAQSCGGWPRKSPNLIIAANISAFIFHSRLTILPQKDWSVQVNDVAMLAQDERRGHRETCADHVPDHDLHTQRASPLANE